MSMIESIEADIVYNCDLCGERFNSVDDAQKHSQKAHPELALNNDSDRGLWTSTPAEDKEDERVVDAILLHEMRQRAASLLELSKM